MHIFVRKPKSNECERFLDSMKESEFAVVVLLFVPIHRGTCVCVVRRLSSNVTASLSRKGQPYTTQNFRWHPKSPNFCGKQRLIFQKFPPYLGFIPQ